jgi:hypothetical protein
VKESKSHTPFSLVFGTDVVLHVEGGIPSTRVTYYDQYKNDEDKPINLDLLPETPGECIFESRSLKTKDDQTIQQASEA